MARPPKPADEVRSQVLQLRLTANERAAMADGAKKAEETLTQFIRVAALERAGKAAADGRKSKPAQKK